MAYKVCSMGLNISVGPLLCREVWIGHHEEVNEWRIYKVSGHKDDAIHIKMGKIKLLYSKSR